MTKLIFAGKTQDELDRDLKGVRLFHFLGSRPTTENRAAAWLGGPFDLKEFYFRLRAHFRERVETDFELESALIDGDTQVLTNSRSDGTTLINISTFGHRWNEGNFSVLRDVDQILVGMRPIELDKPAGNGPSYLAGKIYPATYAD